MIYDFIDKKIGVFFLLIDLWGIYLLTYQLFTDLAVVFSIFVPVSIFILRNIFVLA